MNIACKIIEGRKIADEIIKKAKSSIGKKNKKPILATILIGNDEASRLYVDLKEKACLEAGIIVKRIEFPSKSNENEVINKIKELNTKVDGILVQLPLPSNLNQERILNSIDYKKDIDGLTSVSLGKLMNNEEENAPCTAKAVIFVLEENKIELKGKNIALIGSGNVGKPLSIMLLNRNAAVNICNEFTKDIKNLTLKADIVISCAGHPEIIKKDMIKENAVVIDVGISKRNNKVTGDVSHNVKERAGIFCPVPGGIGPITIAMLITRLAK